jgi:ATP-dependent RNA helicase DeaD
VRDGRARVLVATDVASRGLDLPDLTLVIHADLPNDPETLLHRSGRTGRAGRKGICMLVVPASRQRKAETLLYAAKLRVRWGAPPAADEIRERDNERFLADPVFTEDATEAELAEVAALQAARTSDQIALALVRLNRQKLPATETIVASTSSSRRTDRPAVNRPRSDQTRPERPGFRVMPDGETA